MEFFEEVKETWKLNLTVLLINKKKRYRKGGCFGFMRSFEFWEDLLFIVGDLVLPRRRNWPINVEFWNKCNTMFHNKKINLYIATIISMSYLYYFKLFFYCLFYRLRFIGSLPGKRRHIDLISGLPSCGHEPRRRDKVAHRWKWRPTKWPVAIKMHPAHLVWRLRSRTSRNDHCYGLLNICHMVDWHDTPAHYH